MTIQAQSADGLIHEFPDGTDPGVIDRVMKNYAVAKAGAQHASLSDAATDVPDEIKRTALANIETMRQGLPQSLGGPRDMSQEGTLEGLGKTGSALAGIPGLVFSPITGAARSLIGHPMAQAEHAIGTVVNPSVAAKDDPEAMYRAAAGDVEAAMPAVMPGRGGLATLRGPIPMPARPAAGPFGVTLSEGQTTRELPAIQREQAALRGGAGDRAQSRAQDFFDQQMGQLQNARDRVAEGFDAVGGQKIADTPQQAGDIVSQSMQRTAANAKAGVKQAYDTARSYPGEVDADAFRNLGPSIKSDLSNGPNPVIIDDQLTPRASRAIAEVERAQDLNIQNRASPQGQPPAQSVVGVSLEGVDQVRKRLSTLRKDAYSSGNAADGRATQAVLDAFDDHIDRAINGGAFNGDPRAVQAWNDARAAYSDYRKTFTAGKNDPIGRVVEKITGKGNNPAAIPNDVADFMYGGTGVNPNSLNVGVANRIKGIMGEQSPEWAAVKQGLFSRLVEPPPGMTEWGSGKIAQRLTDFLSGNGKEMAEAVFSPAERAVLHRYAELHRAIEVPQAGANWSNTATFMQKATKAIGDKVGAMIGATVGGTAGAVFGGPAGAAGGAAAGATLGSNAGKVGQVLQAHQIASQLPLVTKQLKIYQRAVAAANRANSPLPQSVLAGAAANLARALAPFGISPDALAAQNQ